MQDGISRELRCGEYRVIGDGAVSQKARDLAPDAAYFLSSSVECARVAGSRRCGHGWYSSRGMAGVISLLNLSGQCQNRE